MLVDGPTPDESARVAEHLEYLRALAAQGSLILAGRTQSADPSGFGIVVFAAESEEAARAIVAADPAVRSNVMQADLFPYRIAVFAPANHAS
jgi:uncharacterized protein YciI